MEHLKDIELTDKFSLTYVRKRGKETTATLSIYRYGPSLGDLAKALIIAEEMGFYCNEPPSVEFGYYESVDDIVLNLTKTK